MLRSSLVLILLLALPGSALATTYLEVAVGPDDAIVEDGVGTVTPQNDPYVLWIIVEDPEEPHEVPEEDSAMYDCSFDDRAADPVETADRLADDELLALTEHLTFLLEHGYPMFSVSGFVPECVAGPKMCTPVELCNVYASYDVTTGRYFVGDPYTGTTGVRFMADCEACPPPACC